MSSGWRESRIVVVPIQEPAVRRGVLMSKGMDQKKSEKKKPQKTLEEKRAAKREKRANKR